VKRLPIDNLSLAEVPKIDHRISQRFQLVAGNFRWLNLSGTRNTPAFPPISIN
jgi:hypothetical protein